jgi:hypothetical protein
MRGSFWEVVAGIKILRVTAYDKEYSYPAFGHYCAAVLRL